jgi:hypothetical protein
MIMMLKLQAKLKDLFTKYALNAIAEGQRIEESYPQKLFTGGLNEATRRSDQHLCK